MIKKSKHILVIRLSALGDVAMSVPVIKALVKQNPEIKITILTRAFFRPLFEGLDNVQIFIADVDNEHKGLVGLYRLQKDLKLLNIDAIADIHNVLRSKILRILSGLSQDNIAVIDKGRAEKEALTRSNNKIFKQLKSSHERYADVFRQLGYKVDLSNPEFPNKQELVNYPFNVKKEKGINWIGIAPFAQYQSKMYPIDLMDELISLLGDSNKYQLFLFGGGKKEIAILEKLSSKYNNVINVAGKIKLKKELDLIAHLDLMLSMDSANSHLAAMLGVKTIILWGITHPFAGFAPFNQPFERMILPDLEMYPNIPCSIYGNKICKGYEDVMRTILPKKIENKIKKCI